MSESFYKEYYRENRARVCRITLNGNHYKSFQYNSVSSFQNELSKVGNELMEKNINKIGLHFFSNKDTKMSLNFYTLLEFLLFIGGIQVTLTI